LIKFQEASTLSAARAHVSSLRWRIAVNTLFAVGASFALHSVGAGFGWFLAVMLSTLFDAMLGHSYLESRGKARNTAGVLFVWGCAFSVIVFAAMTLYLAYAGGGPGRVLAVLMAASSIVSVMLFLFQAPVFMLVTAAPAAICLLAMPFLPFQHDMQIGLQGAAGAACGVAGFLAFVVRAALYNGRMVMGLRQANKEAKERQVEAECRQLEAEEANRAKSEFLAVMTHELRTPLNAVIGYSEIIHEDMHAEGRNELADDAARITGSARHLLGLIDQILNLSSIDAGAEGVAPVDIDVRKLIDETVAAAREEANKAGNRISVRVAADAARAHTDATKLTVCLNAIISNAVKFTSNGLISVMADCICADGRNWLTIAVSDTGIGIAADDLSRVFMPFTQIDSTATRTKGGMGLGLSIAQRMAHTLGGDLSALSEVGVGSTFTIRIPLRLEVSGAVRAAA
jgi:signal transduction histidine kinase